MVEKPDVQHDPGFTPDSIPVSDTVCPECARSGSGDLLLESIAVSHQARGLNAAAIILAAGLYLASLSLFADVLGFGGSEGFGWQQGAGVVLGGVLLLTGTLLRVPTLLAIGLATGALTLLADWLAFGDSEGFGGHQVLGTFAGVALIAVGLVLARTKSRASAA